MTCVWCCLLGLKLHGCEEHLLFVCDNFSFVKDTFCLTMIFHVHEFLFNRDALCVCATFFTECDGPSSCVTLFAHGWHFMFMYDFVIQESSIFLCNIFVLIWRLWIQCDAYGSSVPLIDPMGPLWIQCDPYGSNLTLMDPMWRLYIQCDAFGSNVPLIDPIWRFWIQCDAYGSNVTFMDPMSY